MDDENKREAPALRKLTEHELVEEGIYRVQLRSSHARMPGETVVDKAEREAREAEND